ncbi:MAG: helix-turn-helix transcriptional regulator [Lachnospiraceae bacterium]|nr:helix-turn-helix transcriptional regulator [Lachnospiraceae bacterium]
MRRKGQVLLSLILYILILAGALHFDLWKLIDIRLILLMVLGTVVLTLPFYEKGISRGELGYIFGRKAIEAGFIQTFLLLFMELQSYEDNYENKSALLRDIAMSFRPLLYGFCMQILFSEKGEEKRGETDLVKSRAEDEEKADLNLSEKLKAYGLTKRELEIAGLIAEGKSNGEIAEQLYISETTVKKHVSNIFEKMGISKREELIRIAFGGKEPL